jgi:serine protease Do
MTRIRACPSGAALGLWLAALLTASAPDAHGLDAAELAPALAISKALAAVAREAVPAVVSVRVEKTFEAAVRRVPPSYYNDPFDFFGDEFLRRFLPDYELSHPQRFKQSGQGSGFLISEDGYILTNNHVVGDADKIRVRLHDGREFDAKRIGSDPRSEVAVIKIEGHDFPCLRKGDSAALEIGELVIAIGNPFGLNETVTVGVVSAKGRGMRITDYEDFIQTDAAINPGNSGGPLLNIEGAVVGINTAIYSQSGGYQGIGFAIPINVADAIREQMVRTGRVTRGYLGVSIQELTADLAESLGLSHARGILVTDVERGSPAAAAGIEPADVIVKLDGRDVTTLNAFRYQVSAAPPGSELALTIQREDRALEIKARTGAVPGEEETESVGAGMYEQLGLTVADLGREAAEVYGYDLNEGALVTEVEPDGLAAAAGLQPGALITRVNRNRISSEADFRTELGKAADAPSVVLLVKRGRSSQYYVLKLR